MIHAILIDESHNGRSGNLRETEAVLLSEFRMSPRFAGFGNAGEIAYTRSAVPPAQVVWSDNFPAYLLHPL